MTPWRQVDQFGCQQAPFAAQAGFQRVLAAREARQHVSELDAALKAAFAANNKANAELAKRLQEFQADSERAEREHSRQIAAARNAFQSANDPVVAGERHEKAWDSLFKGQRIDPQTSDGLQLGQA